MSSTSTPYDDMFRTLLNDCSSLILPVINEIFGEHYTGKEEIIFAPNEHFLNRQDGDETKRITDNSFKVLGKTPKKYHWECQSSADSSMLVRFFEYDVKEEVKSVMGGKVLDYEAKTIRNEGRQEGIQEGILLSGKIFRKVKSNSGYTNDQIAKELGFTLQEVESTRKMFGI